MTPIQLKILDELINTELSKEDERVLLRLSLLRRELFTIENEQLISMYDKYFSYGRE